MDRQQAQNIIKETFENPFVKERFIEFAKNLLNTIEEAPFSYKGNFIPDAYEQYISSLERIGKYNAGDHRLDVLIVKLKKKTSIERARTMQRNFIAWYLNGSRGGEMKDAALAAFVSPDEEDWRFSLIKMDYRFDEGKDGRVKSKKNSPLPVDGLSLSAGMKRALPPRAALSEFLRMIGIILPFQSLKKPLILKRSPRNFSKNTVTYSCGQKRRSIRLSPAIQISRLILKPKASIPLIFQRSCLGR